MIYNFQTYLEQPNNSQICSYQMMNKKYFLIVNLRTEIIIKSFKTDKSLNFYDEKWSNIL